MRSVRAGVLGAGLAVVLAVGVGSPAGGATRRVPADFTTINAALDASAFGDTVLVAPGTYTDSEVRNILGVPTRSCAFMRDGVVLRSEAGPDHTIVDMLGLGGGPSRVVRAESLPSSATSVEGLTLTGAPVGYGGAWVVWSGKVTFRDCIFRDMDAGGSTGAGLAANGDVDVIDCEFVNCVANAGGAIYHSGGHINLIGCLIESCGDMGAYLRGDPPDPESALIEDCVFLDNWADYGGALQISQYDQGAVVRGCWFEGNAAEYNGGAIAWGGIGTKVIEDCVFVRNGTTGAVGPGGSVGIFGGYTTVQGNTFVGSFQEETPFGGATLESGGGVQFLNNVIVGSIGGTAIRGPVQSSCNVFWDNAFGPGIPLGETDREVNPEFCDPENHDFTVRENSPCVEPGALGCGQIGAFGIGCGTVSMEPESWGRIKARYRGDPGTAGR